jgi:hypothetical protein
MIVAHAVVLPTLVQMDRNSILLPALVNLAVLLAIGLRILLLDFAQDVDLQDVMKQLLALTQSLAHVLAPILLVICTPDPK